MADTKISDLAAVTDVLATDEYVLARSGATKKIDASNLLVASEVAFTPAGSIAASDVQAAIVEVAAEAGTGGLFNAYALLQDSKAANTNGGTPTTGAWTKHALGTEAFDPSGIVSVSSDVFTLAAGSYFVEAWAISHQTNQWKIKIRDTTNSADRAIGSSSYSISGTGGAEMISTARGRLTPAGSTNYELQYYANLATAGTNGLGIPTNFSVVEIYAEVMIWREA